ncbi:MAG: DUF1080 domain-containing protein [Salinivenus sp.]
MELSRPLFPVLAFILFLLLGACTSSKESAREASTTPAHHDLIGEVIPQMPAANQQEQSWMNEQLLDMGPDGLRALLDHLMPPNLGNDTHARYAVSGLTKHVSRSDAESERVMLEEVLVEELRTGRSASVSVFLLHQLELIGSDRAVPAVKQLLWDDTLFEPAVEVLVSIQTPTAVQALRAALAEAKEPFRQETLVQALGAVPEASVAEDILPYASAETWRVRRTALRALARSGQPIAADALAEAADTTRGARRHARSHYLLFAERLAEEGHAVESAEVAHQVLEDDHPDHVKQAALSALVQAKGMQALETLLDVGTSTNQKRRRGALSLAQKLPGRKITDAFLSSLDSADPPVRADVISMLGARGDTSALSSLMPYLSDPDPKTRQSAVEAVAALGGAKVLPELLTALNRAEDSEVVGNIETALLQMPTDRLLPAAAEALPAGTDTAKAVLIRIIAARRGTEHLATVLDERTSSDETVRLEVYRALQQLASERELPTLVGSLSEAVSDRERAAVQDAIVAVLDRMEKSKNRDSAVRAMWADASEEQKFSLIGVLPRIGGNEALRVAVQATRSPESEIRASAIETLAEWPETETQAMSALLRVAENAEASNQRIQLLRRYVRLVDASDASVDEKREHLHEAVSTANSPQERALVIDSFSSVESSVGFRAVGEYLSSEEDIVRKHALDVAEELLPSLFNPDTDTRSNVKGVVAVLETPASPELARLFENQFAKSSKDETSSSSESTALRDSAESELFNGENLDGWETVGGSSGGWDVDDGVLYTDGSGHGWLSTARTYDDFRLELEFRVPEGGNSGVFLRAPRQGSPAYEGMEIQILDDYAEQYADLNPLQYTGSIYDVKAPSSQTSRPAGEWQTMVIVADGPRIQVMLNGEMIVNTSLVNHMDRVDEHPGLKRRKGYIGLQNHSTRVEYRNIVIHELNGASSQQSPTN